MKDKRLGDKKRKDLKITDKEDKISGGKYKKDKKLKKIRDKRLKAKTFGNKDNRWKNDR